MRSTAARTPFPPPRLATATPSRTTVTGSRARRRRSRACSASPARWSRPNCCGCRRGARLATACAWWPARSSPRRGRWSWSPATSGSSCAPSVTAARRWCRRARSSSPRSPGSRSCSARRSRVTNEPCRGRRPRSRWRNTARPTPASRRRGGTMLRSSTSCCPPAGPRRCASWSPSSTAAAEAKRERSSRLPGLAA